jgi:imidazolonepropionase-like amidohydrolase
MKTERSTMKRTSLSLLGLALVLGTAPAAAALGEPMVGRRAAPRPAPPAGEAPVDAPAPGEVGGPGLGLRAAKALAVSASGPQVIDDALMIVRDGKIAAIGPAGQTPLPADHVYEDLGDAWLMPGMIDLHSHVAGTFDLNDMVYLTNPGLRAATAVVPGWPDLRKAVAGGVTTVLFIPGSGTNVGGQGVLVKTGLDRYEDMEVRRVGSLKLAQAGNPESWMRAIGGSGRAFMNWHTRDTFRRGLAYASRYAASEAAGEEPERDIQWDVFRALAAKESQVSTHTQMFQVVSMTISMIREEFGLDVYVDHGTFDGYRAAGRAQAAGVPAILGPRSVQVPDPNWIRYLNSNTDGRILGVAAAYQEAGHETIGFNTDAPVIPQEELSVQATVGARYGFDDSMLDTVRGLTIVPARVAGIDHLVGSLEPGKQADVLVLTGHPADPRTSVERVWIEGRAVYDAREGRRW